jgi:hypothetical protein
MHNLMQVGMPLSDSRLGIFLAVDAIRETFGKTGSLLAFDDPISACNDNCDAGGPGSTSCSVSGCAGNPTSCETSCSSGYHSCCCCFTGSPQGAKCECVKN